MKSLIFPLVPLFVLGCGDTTSNNTPDMAMAPTTLGTAPALAVACTDTAADVYNLPTGLPAMDLTHRGDVIRCAPTESMTAAKVNAQINAYNANTFNTTYSPVAGNVTSGFWTFRVAYRTLRNTPTGGGTPAEGESTAILAIPEKPIAGAPLVVFAHGSVGIAPKCAPSLLDLSAPAADQDYPVSIMRLAGYGYTVIVPDYAGYSFNQSPPGYFNAEDEAHSVLDATRAAANLLAAAPDKVVLVGHSQGGHAVLSAQSYAKTYGIKGTLVGVAAFAPLETTMALWAAASTDAAMLTTKDTSSVLYAMEYAYTAGALRGDVGGGLAVFQTAKQQAAKDTMLGGDCYDTAKLEALGNKPSDFFDTDYVSNVGFSCAANPLNMAPDYPGCMMAPSTPAGDAPLWVSRWKEDRPALDPMGGPILIWLGGKDASDRPGFAECSREKFAKDLMPAGATTTIKYCFDAGAQHRDLIRRAPGDYVNEWIAARGGVGSEPGGPCPDFTLPWTDPSGATGMGCETPPNDL
jgi:pimeloyl-ACP methyl ester carboxylesterase